jgi:hypothetical protein
LQGQTKSIDPEARARSSNRKATREPFLVFRATSSGLLKTDPRTSGAKAHEENTAYIAAEAATRRTPGLLSTSG